MGWVYDSLIIRGYLCVFWHITYNPRDDETQAELEMLQSLAMENSYDRGSIECINYDDFFCFFSAKTQQYDDFRVGEQSKYSGICEKLLHLSVK